ncbi:2-oxo-4-hydroxy-4-carboxy-5-ureidoimidazoline decarboxylase [Streptomyces thermoviolaceus subsp. apingens]|nr:2-oxo-4-hydroxy-4-carboxy-5-ureidoimidazoline decarboxylase [Streptomyces thermoviolaceus subsp. apingens]
MTVTLTFPCRRTGRRRRGARDPVPRRGPTLPALNPQCLEHFNTAPAPQARRTLLTCLRSPHWAGRLAAHRPYPDLPALLAAADEATYDLDEHDLARALAAEPPPALPEGAYTAASTALNAAYAAYADKFGHPFVLCLDDVPPGEVLDRLLAAVRSRLTNDPVEERTVAAEELRRLARGRLTHALQGRDQPRRARMRPAPRRARPASAPADPSVHV